MQFAAQTILKNVAIYIFPLPPPPPKKKIDSTSKSLHAHIASWNLQVHVTTLYNVHQSNKREIFN